MSDCGQGYARQCTSFPSGPTGYAHTYLLSYPVFTDALQVLLDLLLGASPLVQCSFACVFGVVLVFVCGLESFYPFFFPFFALVLCFYLVPELVFWISSV
ncbi:hypothetical protein BOTBODRAFT_484298 [Botryobasidium botryosum FD-172 SS1]|uniref:Uncharacterized protein n=1 Tax=Botryobasidium botryosum (strain FD-172 SS1) TaxID=930990 RepID=A0A067MU24_BOTB1|nr:hypothetical protein BOTBODRAFT_484298 [Botryobasidium botryosum FD-172 SS1]